MRSSLKILTWLRSLDSFANRELGRPIADAVASETCAACGGAARTFTSDAASSDYLQTGECEPCQRKHAPDRSTVLLFTPTRPVRAELS